MTIFYAILNPSNGTYTNTNTIEERDALIAQRAIDVLMTHTHGEPFSVVEVGVDGSETWRTPTGEERPSDADLKNRASLLLAKLLVGQTSG